MPHEYSALTESPSILGAGLKSHDTGHWRADWRVDKFYGRESDVLAGKVTPYETLKFSGNLLMNGGADILWYRLTKKNPTTANSTLRSAFSTKGALAAGNSSATSTASQTDMQGASKARVIMDAGYPTHTSGTSTNARSASFRATFSTSKGNFAWKEWGLFNSTSTGATAFRLLNRKVQSLGTKTSAATWQFTVTLTLS